jgi:CubicO group peptidase (beta-lactamase class C family)
VEQKPHPWGYGYQVWLMPGPRRTFVMEGIEGQRIFIDPATHLVLVHTAVRLKPVRDVGESELIALWRSLLRTTDVP